MADPRGSGELTTGGGLAEAGDGTAETRRGVRRAGSDHPVLAPGAAAEVGAWDWDVASGRVVWDRRVAELYGVDLDSFGGTLEAALAAVHPEDVPAVRAALDAAVRSGSSFVEEHRVLRPDGSQVWLQGRGWVVSSSAGRATRMAGVCIDTTRLRTVRDQVGRAVEHAGDAVVMLDAEDRFVFVNVAAVRLLGRASAELVGRPAWDLLPAAPGGGPLRDAYRWAVEAGMPLEVEVSGVWFEVRMHATPDGLTVVLINVDERHRADVERARLISSLSQALARSRQLLGTTSALGGVLTVADVADVVFRTAVADLEVTFAGIVLFQDECPGRIMTWPRLPLVSDIWAGGPNPGPAATVEILHTGRPRFDPTRADYVTDYPDRREMFDALGIHRSANMPLIASGRIIGVLSLGWSGPRPFDEEERAYLRTLAGVYGQAIERARLYERQTSVVDALQRAILPQTLPELPGVELVARYLPAGRDAGIGGDWYDAAVRPDDTITLVVGDVAGHGLPAVTTMAELRHAARAYALEGHSPAEIVTQLSVNLAGRESESLASAVVANLAPRTGRLTWSCAGHPPPLLLTGSDAGYLDDVHGPLLGVDPTFGYGHSERDLPPAARLLLYSDGLVERRGTALTDRLDTLAATAAGYDPHRDLGDLCDRILADVAGPAGREDDLCLLAVRTL
jgi:PAS domain S-box-containing protein